MRAYFLLLPLILLGAFATPGAVVFVLSPASQTAVNGDEVFFSGSLSNSAFTGDVFLNDLQITFTNAATNFLTADTNVFFANVPGVLLPAETYQDVVFGIALNPAIAPGLYSGQAGIFGGTNIFATNLLATQTFQIIIPAAALRLALSNTSLNLAWSSFPAASGLQQNFNLVTTNWTAVTNVPVMTNGQNKVTLPFSGTNRFYRLAYP